MIENTLLYMGGKIVHSFILSVTPHWLIYADLPIPESQVQIPIGESIISVRFTQSKTKLGSYIKRFI